MVQENNRTTLVLQNRTVLFVANTLSLVQQQFPLTVPVVAHGGLEPLWSKVA